MPGDSSSGAWKPSCPFHTHHISISQPRARGWETTSATTTAAKFPAADLGGGGAGDGGGIENVELHTGPQPFDRSTTHHSKQTYRSLLRADGLFGDQDLGRFGGGDGSEVGVGETDEGRNGHREKCLELRICGGGLRCDVMRFNEMCLDGMGWDGMGWDGRGWGGMGWGGEVDGREWVREVFCPTHSSLWRAFVYR